MTEQFKPTPAEFIQPPELKPGDTVTLEIDGEMVECTFAVYSAQDFDPNINPDVKYLIKTEPVKVVIAKGGEQIASKQDGIPPRTAESGQVIIQNKPDSANPESPYIFGNDGQSPEQQHAEFLEKYEPIADRPGYYRKKALPMAVIPVDQATAIRPSWDPTGLMGTPAGGVVAEGGYTINPQSLADSYQFVEDQEEAEDHPYSFTGKPRWFKRVFNFTNKPSWLGK
jgi:hypothetical protein